MSEPYEKHVEYHFTVFGEGMVMVVSKERDFVEVSELRKNGQEDCHYGAGLALRDGVWESEDPSMDEYRDRDDARRDFAVIAHIVEHGLPPIDDE